MCMMTGGLRFATKRPRRNGIAALISHFNLSSLRRLEVLLLLSQILRFCHTTCLSGASLGQCGERFRIRHVPILRRQLESVAISIRVRRSSSLLHSPRGVVGHAGAGSAASALRDPVGVALGDLPAAEARGLLRGQRGALLRMPLPNVIAIDHGSRIIPQRHPALVAHLHEQQLLQLLVPVANGVQDGRQPPAHPPASEAALH
mmetsp:Transcript_13260/g.18164  ORF Transcript_13260/g.18164 Transcript_13260/m.18164 type:complete len:203 (-) Transcript_13260:3478-4086(-)